MSVRISLLQGFEVEERVSLHVVALTSQARILTARAGDGYLVALRHLVVSTRDAASVTQSAVMG